MRKLIFITLLFLFNSLPVSGQTRTISFSEKPEHAVLIIVDGLSYKAWENENLPVMENMLSDGALVEKTFLPPAAHPKTGSYAEIHTCSIPNPILMSGTLFITKNTLYLQDMFPGKITAFVANASVYGTIANNYSLSYQIDGKDDDAVNAAIEFMRLYKPSFMRIHLQDTGGAGTQSMTTSDNSSWKQNIWAQDSPYRKSLIHADRLIGLFAAELAKEGVLEKTVIIITGDHGQSDTGWHPLELWDSSITTTIFSGAGIKKGTRIPYSELIDITPTICRLMDVQVPDTVQGRVIGEILLNPPLNFRNPAEKIKELNIQFAEYRKKKNEVLHKIENLNSVGNGGYFSTFNNDIEANFYDISKFSEWTKFNSIDALLENNGNVLKELDKLAEKVNAGE